MSLDSDQDHDAYVLRFSCSLEDTEPPAAARMAGYGGVDECIEGGAPCPNGDDLEELGGHGSGGLGFHRVNSKDVVFYEDKMKAKIIGNRYLMGSLLGEGCYGKVKEVLDLDTLTRRAVKIVARKKLRRIPNGEQSVRTEMQILRGLDHPNVIKLWDVLVDSEKQKTYMVFEFGVIVMQELLRRAPENRFPIAQAHSYFSQLCRGLEYLHSQGVIHKDIKADNLLLTVDGVVKIADLGVAEQLDRWAGMDDTCHTSQGSPAVQSPEVANGADTFHGFKLDVWSSGVTLFNITTGKYPFEGDTIYKLFDAIGRGEVVWPDGVEAQLRSLLEGMLSKDPDKRLSLQQVFKHPWMQRKPANNEVWVAVPVTEHDPYRSLTVMSALEDMQQRDRQSPLEEGSQESLTAVPLAAHSILAGVSMGGGVQHAHSLPGIVHDHANELLQRQQTINDDAAANKMDSHSLEDDVPAARSRLIPYMLLRKSKSNLCRMS
ncbi:serine/threonine-protein kinase STK11-like [Tropilaelaps mercedesae]|uniref:non-specific serine/threonine protein kinase n=1 Tax=Tropilaelaps mercedesae TaxID=418985 RepID=A0A1V9XHK4_9ACAR|nr:serine/threonine-protein kinase STK11-like [Tropilaelaps mercedesae]